MQFSTLSHATVFSPDPLLAHWTFCATQAIRCDVVCVIVYVSRCEKIHSQRPLSAPSSFQDDERQPKLSARHDLATTDSHGRRRAPKSPQDYSDVPLL